MRTRAGLAAITFVIFAVFLYAASAVAQTTIVSDTSKATWGPSPDNAATFGTPATPVVTKYVGELFAKDKVDNRGVPSGQPALTLDFGKPAVVGGIQSSPLLKPLIQTGVEYVLFVTAMGPGGSSDRLGPTPPFGFPPAPRAATAAVTIAP